MSEIKYSQTTNNQNSSIQQVQQVQNTSASQKTPETYGDFVGFSILILIVSVLWLRKHK